MKCFREEDEESCLPKSAEVLVVIENMTILIKLACVYIYIYARGFEEKFDDDWEGKKVFVCLVLRSPPSKLYVLVGFFLNLLFVSFCVQKKGTNFLDNADKSAPPHHRTLFYQTTHFRSSGTI